MALCRRIEKAAHVGDFLALFDDDRLRQTSLSQSRDFTSF